MSVNQGATFITHSPVFHTKLKHVAMNLRFVRERSEKGSLEGQEHYETNRLSTAVQ